MTYLHTGTRPKMRIIFLISLSFGSTSEESILFKVPSTIKNKHWIGQNPEHFIMSGPINVEKCPKMCVYLGRGFYRSVVCINLLNEEPIDFSQKFQQFHYSRSRSFKLNFLYWVPFQVSVSPNPWFKTTQY